MEHSERETFAWDVYEETEKTPRFGVAETLLLKKKEKHIIFRMFTFRIRDDV